MYKSIKTMLQTALAIDKKSLFLCIAYNLIKQLMNVFYGVYFLRMILAGLETSRSLIAILTVLVLMFGINILYSCFDQYYRNIYLPVFKLKADCHMNEKIMEKANAIPYDRANSPGELDWYNRVLKNSSEMMLQAYQSFGLICGLLEAFAMVLSYLIHTDAVAILFSAFPLLYSYFLGEKSEEAQYELSKKVSSAARKKEYARRVHYLREYAAELRTSKAGSIVSSAEEYMTAFALGKEVHSLLLEPEDAQLLESAQKYTEDFAAVKGIFEGLYIATPETYVLTHTSPQAIGITTRSGESLELFQDTILATEQLTNSGIMKSPGTGSMILSMYYPIFEDGSCIGYVGAGVFADRLMDVLLGLDIKGLPGSEYVFLNVDTGVYLYHEDEELLNTETTDSGYQEIIRRIKTDGDTQAGTYTYEDENGVDQLVVYKYLKDRGWVFMVRDSAAEVFGAVAQVRVAVGTLCAAVAVVIILVTLLILYRQGKELMAVERAIRHLGSLNLSADGELEKFYGRKDEIGMIAQTIHDVCGYLRKTVEDMGRILGEMADGNIAVDVARNETFYIGDFRILAESLKTIRTNLTELMRDISGISSQVDTGAEQLSGSVHTLSEGAVEQSASVEGLAANVTEITAQIKDSNLCCHNASQLVDKANGYAAEADAKMAQLKVATENIEKSSAKIGSIIKTIEDIAL